MGKMATSPLPPRGSRPLQSGGQNQKWPIHGQGGYRTPAASGINTASKRGAISEVAHTWARWLHNPCRLGDQHRFKAGGKIRSGPYMGKVATSPLPPRGSPPLQSGGQNQKWPINGHGCYITPAASGIPDASKREAKSEVANKWAWWLHHPCRLGDPHRFKAGAKIRSGPYMGKVATSPLPPRGSTPLQSEGQNQEWPTSGQGGYITPATSGIPTAAKRGAKSEVAHTRARWLHNPCRLGDRHRFKAGGKIRSGPQVNKVATSPLPPWGSPPLQSGGQNQRWRINGQGGYITPAASGIFTASKRGAKSEVAHKWARLLHHPCRLGYPRRFKAGGKIRSGPQVGEAATSPMPPRGSPPLQSGGQNQKWPINGQGGYITAAAWGSPPLQSGGQNQKWPINGQGGYITPAAWGSPPLQSGGQNQRWRINGQGGYITPAASGIFTASKRGAKSEVAHKWARLLHHPCRLGYPRRFKAGGKIRSGPQVGKVATSPLPPRGSPPLQRGGQNQEWPTSGQDGYITPAASGIPTASKRGAKSEVAHTWARWLHNPCRLGDPHRFKARGKIRSGPYMGKVAT